MQIFHNLNLNSETPWQPKRPESGALWDSANIYYHITVAKQHLPIGLIYLKPFASQDLISNSPFLLL